MQWTGTRSGLCVVW